MNLISKDLDPIGQCVHMVPFLFTAPVELLVISLLLLLMIGWEALIGVAYMLLCTLLRGSIGRVYRKLRRNTAYFTDQRLHLLSEVLSGIQAIKMNVWERVFENLFKKIRRFVSQHAILCINVTFTLRLMLFSLCLLLTVAVTVLVNQQASQSFSRRITVFKIFPMFYLGNHRTAEWVPIRALLPRPLSFSLRHQIPFP